MFWWICTISCYPDAVKRKKASHIIFATSNGYLMEGYANMNK